ncbi:MAG TPA: DUF1295 domain-containing protein, partial [Candidatus Saccharimonadales bacterium]|nr:DUF1295 domain-containing protein [Candidatus Saccharimonadales bacterium]
IWAVRLGGFLLYRISKTGKDSRFDNIRDNFIAFGRFWLGQGLSVWVILLPALVAFTASSPNIAPLAWIGVVVWALGLALESAADWQKFTFNSLPANKGKWIQSGVWKYSRHPNYMGEMLVWIGLYLYAVSVLSLPLGIAVAVGPLFIISLLLFISGIPLLEKFADARWGTNAEYKKYKSRTSMLIPWPPKKT